MEQTKNSKAISKPSIANFRKNQDLSREPQWGKDPSLVQLSVSEEQLPKLDHSVIQKNFYNNFDFSKLPLDNPNRKFSLGITSANRREGKTLAASNMAVSLAQAYHQQTVLVDFNFENPELHKVFGARKRPGISEAVQNNEVFVNSTKVDYLYLLTAGNTRKYYPGIRDTLMLRQILYTLKKEFDFVIVDLGAVFPIEDFPIHFINEVDGLLTVIDATNTKKEQFQNIYKHIDKNRFVGYIFNRIDK
jgi:Mrp family chromosome partitioning ATPase